MQKLVPLRLFEKGLCCQDTESLELNDLNTWKDIAVVAFCNLMANRAKANGVDLRSIDGEISENALFPADWSLEFRTVRDWLSQPHIWTVVGIGKDQNFPVLRTVFSSYSKPGKQKQMFEENKRPDGKVEWTLTQRDLFAHNPHPPQAANPTPKRKKILPAQSLDLDYIVDSVSGVSTPTKSPKVKKVKLSNSLTPTTSSSHLPNSTIPKPSEAASGGTCESCLSLNQQNSLLFRQLNEANQRLQEIGLKLAALEDEFAAKEREISTLSVILLEKQNQEEKLKRDNFNLELNEEENSEGNERRIAIEDLEVDFSKLTDDNKSDGSDEMEIEFEEKIKNLTNEIEKMAPNMRAVDRLDEVEIKLKETAAEFESARRDAKNAKDKFNLIKSDRTKLFVNAFEHISGKIDSIYKELTRSKTFPLGGTAYLSMEATDMLDKY
ncbi:Structural maintenance of chromosomes protein 1 [Nowakowskiella sp. JEL0078]|nr:Structural maintenance of chromosomes protein 1 [Nowakowskiella sp. JEL0078]